jgi:hypothetical protein
VSCGRLGVPKRVQGEGGGAMMSDRFRGEKQGRGEGRTGHEEVASVGQFKSLKKTRDPKS